MEQWNMMRSGAHEAEIDVNLMDVLDRIAVKRIREEGRIVQNYVNLIPEEQAFLDILDARFTQDVDEFGSRTRQNVLLNFKGYLLNEDASNEELSFIAKQYNRKWSPERTSEFDDVIQKISAMIGDESLPIDEKTASIVGEASEYMAKVYDGKHMDMVEKLSVELGMDLTDALKAVDNFKYAQRGVAAGLLGMAAIGIVTNKIKENTTTYDSWKRSNGIPLRDYESKEKIRKYNKEMAYMGDMTIESNRRRNYSYNMRNDRHDHLFKE